MLRFPLSARLRAEFIECRIEPRSGALASATPCGGVRYRRIDFKLGASAEVDATEDVAQVAAFIGATLGLSPN